MRNRLNFSWILLISAFLLLGCKNDKGDSNRSTQAIPTTGNPTIDQLTQQIVDNPNDPSLYAARAGAYYQVEGFDEAIADLAMALRYDSTNIEYHHVLADIYLDYYQSSLALKTMERAAALAPERIPTLLKLSEFQFILKQNSPSLKTINKILTINPQESEAYYMMGRNFYDMNDDKRAIGSFQKAVSINSDLIEGWIYLGELFGKKEDKMAIQYFDNALEVDSTHLDALNGKSNYYHQRGQLAEAIQMYHKIHRLHPQDADAYYRSGLANLELDSVQMAYDQFDLAIKMEPTKVMAYFYRGAVSELKGNIESAKNDYQQALNLSPDFDRAQKALDNLK